jgi:hypothetical protein
MTDRLLSVDQIRNLLRGDKTKLPSNTLWWDDLPAPISVLWCSSDLNLHSSAQQAERKAARKAFETVAQDLITAPDKKSDPIINSDW